MKLVSGVLAAVSILAIIGVAFLYLMNANAMPTIALGLPDIPRVALPSDTDSSNDRDTTEEVAIVSNPQWADTDGDGLVDDYENSIGTNPMASDTDTDGLPDGEEVKRGTDPLNRNTDGDKYDDAVDSDPLMVNFADIIVTAQNLQTQTKTDNAIVVEALTGNRHMNPRTVLYTVEVDTTVRNAGNDYTPYVTYDVVITINGEEVRRIPESISRMDAGSTITRHYEDGIRLVDLPSRLADQISAEKMAEFTVVIENISFERF